MPCEAQGGKLQCTGIGAGRGTVIAEPPGGGARHGDRACEVAARKDAWPTTRISYRRARYAVRVLPR
jgi:hypothetical protein